MKKCFKCGEIKELFDFYKHPKMADGHVNKCKECNKKDVRENRLDKIHYYTQYDKFRFVNDPSRKERNDKYAAENIGKSTAVKNAYLKRNPEKHEAHGILQRAVRSGKVVKPEKCERCGIVPPKARLLHGHHHDYSKPLDVEWICIWCHADEHRHEWDLELWIKFYAKFV